MPAQRLFLRGNTWWTSFYVNGIRQRVSTGCRDKKAGELRARELERRAADPTHAAAHETTLSEALEAILPDREAKGRAQGTIDMYASKAGHWLRILGDDTPLALAATADAVDRFVETRTREGTARSTIGKELTTFRAALKIALRRGKWNGRIEAIMPEGFSLEYKPKKRALTRAEYDALAAELRADRAAHVAFIVGTSARWIESVRARPGDVADEEVTLRGTKTDAAERIVPLVGFMAELVVPAVCHLPFAPWASVRRDLAAACERAGIAAVTPNDLRRTTATWLRASGVAPHLIAVVLGHVDSRMVERVYGRIPTDALREALAARLTAAPRCDTGVSAAVQNGGLGGGGGAGRVAKSA